MRTRKIPCGTSGGKGNFGKFTERDSRICAAGVTSRQPELTVADAMKQYLLQDEVDALISDAIKPKMQLRPLPPLRHPLPKDKRYAGPYCDMTSLINPPIKSKFQQLVDDMKDTSYSSYWKKPVGQIHDQVPLLPEGMDIYKTTYGKTTPCDGRLYDIIMPPIPLPDKTPHQKRPGVQTCRNYCSPPFLTHLTYGKRSNVDKRGVGALCCLRDDKKILGTDLRVVVNSIQADHQDITQPQIGQSLAPNNNIDEVPDGYAFGKLHPPSTIADVLCYCKYNPGVLDFRKSIQHLNKVRLSLSKRYLPKFFLELYRNLKYFDKQLTGWLQKDVVYNFCGSKMIRFDPSLIEPLLAMLGAFDGSQIDYKIFAHILNYREPIIGLARVNDILDSCVEFTTTYREMVKPGQKVDLRPVAGFPLSRLDLDFPSVPDGYCKADRITLCQECDVKSRIAPSILQLMNVSHRDMYEKREQCVIKKVFEGAGEKFSDARFCAVWEEAAKQHPEGWVCYETFRRALEAIPDDTPPS